MRGLASHHATCPEFVYSLRSRMGKARPQKSQQSWDSQRDDQDWSGHGSYRGRWWSGAFKTWGKYSPKAKARGKAFPRYDVEWQDPGISVVAETRLQEPPKRNSLAKVIQDAVNLLRNAEGHIQKLNSDIQEKARRWETYQSELQKSIQQEYHRHLAALDRLEQEIADATSQEENAKELLARAMAGAAAQEPNTQAGKAWASLIAGIPGEAAMDIDADSIGRRLDEFLHAPTLGGPASTPAPASVHVPSQASGPPGLPEPPDTTFGPVRTHTLVDRRVWQGRILICRAALLPLLVVGRSPGLHKRPWLRKTFEPLARYSIAAVGSMCLSLGDLSFCGVAGFCFSHYVGLVSPRASQVGSRQGPFVCERMWR